MSRDGAGRTQKCSQEDARTRLRHARKFLEVAALVAGEGDDIEYSSQAAALPISAAANGGELRCGGRRLGAAARTTRAY